MNRLCWDVEKWHNQIKWFKRDNKFDYNIMINEDVVIDDVVADIIEQIFLEYNKEIYEWKKDERSIQREYGEFELDWNCFYDRYREQCFAVCGDKVMLVNIIVKLCYEKYPKKSKNFLWNMVGNYVVDNVKPVDAMLPMRDEVDGDFEYLGKRYRLVEKVVAEDDGSSYVAWGDDEECDLDW